MADVADNNVLIDDLKGKDYFTSDDLRAWYNDHGIEVTDESLRVKIHRWKAKGLIHILGKGKYAMGYKPMYKPDPDDLIRNINKKFLAAYSDLDYCIWSTKELQDYMVHFPVRYIRVLETEKDAVEFVFHFLKDEAGVNAYYRPDQDQVYRYVVSEEDAIVVKPMITRSPVITVENIKMPAIEKILVDLYCDDDLYFAYSGRDLDSIYENMLKNYAVNLSTLLRYAERRKKEVEIRAYLLREFGHLVKNILK